MKLNDAVLGTIFVLIALVVLFQARTFPTLPNQPYGPGTFPAIVACIMLLCGGGLILNGVRSRDPVLVLSGWIRTPGAAGRMTAMVAFVVLYILFSKQIGFPLLVPVLLTALLWVMQVRLSMAVPIALLTTGAIWMLFSKLLMVPLPLGLLTEVIY
ncbi:tripartite tricarboxylate transporter TctB family protein [Sedimentitalea nanhaiensis]|uniref:Tripartite tricarboxylate transporter TctB family protein n=1 Tax=Sedimentitalea nanhaiensis TaxID=999627 RepID=A0A1I7BG50_9RHOB|nr:tripartite tricarboxylate transporter TctB family protein [Sedimentitalea nanhaiensis]SFT86091.1 Tripartite tricarboxylate transporter TctB family protein [Sedimentitalea nanhaiensis]